MDSFLTVSKKEERGTPNHRLQNRSVILTGCENHYVIFECLCGLRSGCLTPLCGSGRLGVKNGHPMGGIISLVITGSPVRISPLRERLAKLALVTP